MTYIASIERPAHLTHSRGNDVSFRELTARCFFNEAGSFDA